MGKDINIQIFIHFRECTPIHFYTKSNMDLIMKEDIKSFYKDLDTTLESIQIEKFKGFFDIDNINEFLANYDILDNYYPISPRRKLRQSLKGWMGWRQNRESDQNENYKVNMTPCNDNVFGEIHARKAKEPNNKYLLVSFDAICFTDEDVNVEKVNDSSVFHIKCIELNRSLKKWFDANRIPFRNYHASLKHGENGKGAWSGASKLLCSHAEAANMLSKAIGINGKDELYYFDKKNQSYIIFRYEGNILDNKFHAYHLPKDVILNKSIKQIIEGIIEGEDI